MISARLTYDGGHFSDRYTAALEKIGAAEHAEERVVAFKCLNNRAACACQLQQYRSAIADTTTALAHFPRNAKALMRRGFAYESIERYDEALADMRAVLGIEPSTAASTACARLSTLAAKKKKIDAADREAAAANTAAKASKAAAKTAAKPNAPAADPSAAPAPSSPAAGGCAASPAAASPSKEEKAAGAAAAKARGTASFKKGEYKSAAEAYYEACKLEPACHTHFSNLAVALLKLKQPEHAATAARRCTELEPSFAKGHFRLGQALRSLGDHPAAVQALEAACSHAAGPEAAEIAKELKAAKADLLAQADKLAKGGAAPDQPPAPPAKPEAAAAAAGGAASPPRGPGSAGKARGGGKGGAVDIGRAVETARRAASLASPSSGAPASFIGFERGLRTVWSKGQGGAEDLAAYLAHLPAAAAELTSFVGEGLTEEAILLVVFATQKAVEAGAEPADAGAARLAALSGARRFEMAWMFPGAKEKEAVCAILRAAKGAAAEAAAKKYGVSL